MSWLQAVRPWALVVVGMMVLAGCSRKEAAPEPMRTVKLLQVGAHQAEQVRTYAAEIRARTEVRLGFRVAGKLSVRAVELGQSVRAGQVLAHLDAQDYALGVQAAQAQVQAARTQRDLAQADWQRFSALEAEGFISLVELDRRRASLQAAQAQLEQAQAQAAVQGNQSAYTRLLADASGVITGVHAEPGQVLTAGTPVLTLALDGPRDAVFAVPEHLRASLQLEQPVQVRVWGSATVLSGVVRELAASADPVTRTFTVKVALPDDAQPPLGATAQVDVSDAAARKGQAPEVITLPSSAVWQHPQGGSAVWVWEEASSSVRARRIEVAGAQGSELMVRSGLEPGQKVVAVGVHVLQEGQKVGVYQPAAGAQP